MTQSNLTRRFLAGVVFGFIVILGLSLFSDIQAVSDHILYFNWGLVPIVLALTTFNYTLRGIKFHYYLRLIDPGTVSVVESFRLFVAGFPLAVTPGKVGEALKGVWIHQITGISTAKGISIVVAERISDGMAVLLLSTLGVIAYPRYWPAFVGVMVVLSGVILVSQIRPLAMALVNTSQRIPFVKRFVPGLREFYEGSYVLFKPAPTLIAVGLGTISWLGEGIGFVAILAGLGIPPTMEVFSTAIFIMSFSTVIGAVSALPGGLGAAEASISGMLILLLSLAADTAVAATLLIRFATLWFGVGLGLTVWLNSRELIGLKADSVNTE